VILQQLRSSSSVPGPGLQARSDDSLLRNNLRTETAAWKKKYDTSESEHSVTTIPQVTREQKLAARGRALDYYLINLCRVLIHRLRNGSPDHWQSLSDAVINLLHVHITSPFNDTLSQSRFYRCDCKIIRINFLSDLYLLRMSAGFKCPCDTAITSSYYPGPPMVCGSVEPAF
jgi:hypothetical protein